MNSEFWICCQLKETLKQKLTSHPIQQRPWLAINMGVSSVSNSLWTPRRTGSILSRDSEPFGTCFAKHIPSRKWQVVYLNKMVAILGFQHLTPTNFTWSRSHCWFCCRGSGTRVDEIRHNTWMPILWGQVESRCTTLLRFIDQLRLAVKHSTIVFQVSESPIELSLTFHVKPVASF